MRYGEINEQNNQRIEKKEYTIKYSFIKIKFTFFKAVVHRIILLLQEVIQNRPEIVTTSWIERIYLRKSKISKKHSLVHEICKKQDLKIFTEVNFRWHIFEADLAYKIKFVPKQTKICFSKEWRKIVSLQHCLGSKS